MKSVWRLHDGALVESVLMRYPATKSSRERVTLCVSSQAGCGMNCPFCATGQEGLTRNLSAAEVVEQVLAGARALARGEIAGGPGRVSNVVFMGMGEPMANYRVVMDTVRRLTESGARGAGHVRAWDHRVDGRAGPGDAQARRGGDTRHARPEPARPRRRAARHAGARSTRGSPWPRRSTPPSTTPRRPGRRVSIEYALIRDINDHAWRADLLGKLLNQRGRGWAHVNPIPLNPTPGSIWTASDPAVERAFVAALEARGIPTTIRDTRGREIDGACGQLAATTA